MVGSFAERNSACGHQTWRRVLVDKRESRASQELLPWTGLPQCTRPCARAAPVSPSALPASLCASEDPSAQGPAPVSKMHRAGRAGNSSHPQSQSLQKRLYALLPAPRLGSAPISLREARRLLLCSLLGQSRGCGDQLLQTALLSRQQGKKFLPLMPFTIRTGSLCRKLRRKRCRQ